MDTTGMSFSSSIINFKNFNWWEQVYKCLGFDYVNVSMNRKHLQTFKWLEHNSAICCWQSVSLLFQQKLKTKKRSILTFSYEVVEYLSYKLVG